MLNQLLPQELIIVGIGYPDTTYAFWSSVYARSRNADYGIRRDSSGTEHGAPEFLQFLREELLPWIDSTLRTDTADRALSGHSMSGLFAVYALTHQPSTFRRYLVGSPALWSAGEAPFEWEAAYASSHRELPARVFFYMGEVEFNNISEPTRRLVSTLRARGYRSFDLTDLYVGVDETHTSVGFAALERGLRSVFAPPRAATVPVNMTRFVGEYTDSAGHPWATWRVRVEGDGLVVEAPNFSTPWRLTPESDTSFMSRPILALFVFKRDPGTPTKPALELTAFGNAPVTLRARDPSRPNDR
jgi:hypothetical protein